MYLGGGDGVPAPRVPTGPRGQIHPQLVRMGKSGDNGEKIGFGEENKEEEGNIDQKVVNFS